MKLTLVEKKQEAPDVKSFVFDPAEPLRWKAGQYLHYLLPHEPADDRGTERWFTIASAPYENRPMITTRFAPTKGSTFKAALNALTVGNTIEADGPEGEFVVEDTAQRYVFIAGGIGITPIHSILKQFDHEGVKLSATLLYGSRDTNIAFKSELDAYAANNPGLDIQYLISPEHIDEEAVRKYVPDLGAPLFYISGPEPMVKSLGSTLERMGVPPAHIKLDDFPGYPAD